MTPTAFHRVGGGKRKASALSANGSRYFTNDWHFHHVDRLFCPSLSPDGQNKNTLCDLRVSVVKKLLLLIRRNRL